MALAAPPASCGSPPECPEQGVAQLWLVLDMLFGMGYAEASRVCWSGGLGKDGWKSWGQRDEGRSK
jgi:hypothetical protein